MATARLLILGFAALHTSCTTVARTRAPIRHTFSINRKLAARREFGLGCGAVENAMARKGDDGVQGHQNSGLRATMSGIRRRDRLKALQMLGLQLAMASNLRALASSTYEIHPEDAPDQLKYDAKDQELYEASQALQEALNAPDVQTEERLWTKVINTYSSSNKNWTTDIVGRAYGNRGNSRSRQGKFEEALGDYDVSIKMCPWAVDPVLNRGVALEATGRYEEAIAAYEAVLKVQPNDPAAWNNLGNANMALARYADAVEIYGKAVQLAPEFSFAQANQAIALYASGNKNGASRKFRTLLRRYPDFDDMRAALVASLYSQGLVDNAETEWLRVGDERYNDVRWLKTERRWPQPLLDDMKMFLTKGSYAASKQ